MAIEVSTKNYELLVRYNENGKIGALLRTITTITDDGVLVATPQVGDPKQLDLDELKSIVNGLSEDDWFIPDDEVKQE